MHVLEFGLVVTALLYFKIRMLPSDNALERSAQNMRLENETY